MPSIQPENIVWTEDTAFSDGHVMAGSDMATCCSCGHVSAWGNMSDWYCQDCYDDYNDEEREDEGSFREKLYSASNLPAFQSRTKGKYIKSGRLFSAEIECYYPNSKALRALDLIPDGVGITGDGSLGDNGIELQTPKLKGKKGEEKLKAICELLRKANYRVDRSTGLHTHLDGRGLLPRDRTITEPRALKQLWYFYHVFDDVLLSFLPQSRRSNHFCKPTKDTARLVAIEHSRNLRDLEEIWYRTSSASDIAYCKSHKYDNSRYAGVNLHSLFSSKHIEIRFHGGTLNHVKMLEWISLHQQILDLAARGHLPIELSKQAIGVNISKQTELFFGMLDLPSRTEKYFLQRQKTFAARTHSEDMEEGDTEDATSLVNGQ